MTLLWSTLKMFVWMFLLTGVAYPVLIWAIAQMAFAQKANGDLLSIQGKPRGARLIAQKFESDRYFWPRPSAVDYNPLPSGGSNLGPTSAVLKQQVEERKKRLARSSKDAIPSDLLFASGSGLDPHVSPAAAYFQVERIVKARGWDPQMGQKAISKLIAKMVEGRDFSFLGTPCVNVLLLNLALDELKQLKNP